MSNDLMNWIQENRGNFEEVGALNGDRWNELVKCKYGDYISVDDLKDYLKENGLLDIN